MRRVLLAGILLATTAAAPAGPAGELERDVRDLVTAGWGFDVGVEVHVEGEGIVYSRAADEPRFAASAIKTFVALDLVARTRLDLDTEPAGVGMLLWPGVHPAFAGLRDDQLARVRRELSGRTWRELARIMMGRTAAPNDVYNAACNLVMIKLGGPEAIQERVRGMHEAFSDLVLDHYMLTWNGDGDNRVSPHALVSLYRMIASGGVPGVGPERVAVLRDLLHDGSAGDALFGKPGTLYPAPMARVQAGYLERGDRDLVFAVMGEMRPPGNVPPADAFVVLLASVDSLAARCRRLP